MKISRRSFTTGSWPRTPAYWLLIALLGLPLVTLAKTTSFLLLFVFGLVNLALVFLKQKQPGAVAGIRTYPVLVPLLGLLCSFGMVLFALLAGLNVGGLFR